MELYPLKFTPLFKERVWGGEKLKTVLNKKYNTPHIGESWEISAVPENLSVVETGFLEGNTIEELCEIYMGDLLGDKVYEKFGIDFPLLIKFIDAADDLSIQVHPNDELAYERHNSYGKTEVWYVIDAEPNATLVSGFEREVTAEEYETFLAENRLPELLKTISVKPGDVIYIPAGRIHAIGKGIVVAEIQQSSDVTYRVYDYNRPGLDGKPRQLHTEEALDCLDFSKLENPLSEYANVLNKTCNITESEYFKLNILNFDKPVEKDYILIDSFVIYMCVEGEFEIVENENITKVSKGETVLIPAILKNLVLKPLNKAKLLEIYIP